jgi:hypothetical protein
VEQFQVELEIHRINQEARMNRNAYFDKLALLNGGTVALVITAVLGPLHGVVQHKYLLGAGLTCLVVAMLVLLWRNLQGVETEFLEAAAMSGTPTYTREFHQADKKYRQRIGRSEKVGVWLSALGIVLLLVEVWLILVAPTPTAAPSHLGVERYLF